MSPLHSMTLPSAFTFPNTAIIQNMGTYNQNIPVAASVATYATITNLIYLARRSNVRKMTKRQLWKIRTTREPGVSIRLFLAMLLTWQAFVFIFPLVEPVARCFSHVSFMYSYPNAGGVGIILEPVNVQHLKANKRSKRQIRFDWHRFSVNIGGIGRDGYRHPPSISMNRPHLDIPQLGMKHWPWRRQHKVENEKNYEQQG